MISGNRWLTLAEALENAREIYDYLAGTSVQNRWTSYAVCAMMGNMWVESHVNPGIWQNLDAGNTDLGFGFVQWTPATKLFSWLDANGYAHDSWTGQLERRLQTNSNGLLPKNTLTVFMSSRNGKQARAWKQ